MSNDVTVNIGGNTYKLQEALEAGARAIDGFGREVASSATQAQSALGRMSDAFQLATTQMRYLQSASRTLGEDQAKANLAWLQGATDARDYAERLEFLQSQLGYVRAAQGETSNSIGGELTPQLGKLNQAFGLMGVNLGAGLQGFLALDPEIAAIAIPVGLLLKGVTDLGGGILDLGGKLVELPLDLFQTGIEDSIRLVEQLTDRLVQLGEQGLQQAFSVTEMSEKNLVNWAFLWGGVDTQAGTPGYGTGPGLGPANELLQWSKQASLKMPWTRQDLMAAITTLSGEPGQNVSDIESHLSLISDLAATQGRPGITLNWAAMAAMRGDQGQRRMLLYELKLTPEELANYGYDESDNSTFYPALEKYAKSRGSFGASDFISTQTLWGAQTSMVDRLQNFGMSLMGWNDNPQSLTDDVKQGSPFWYIKKDLSDVAAWFDSHKSELQTWGDLISRALGGGLQLGTTTLGGLGDALQKSGLSEYLQKSLKDFGDFLNNPNTQQTFSQIGEVVGGVLGPGLQDMGSGIQTFLTALSGSGLGQDILSDLEKFGAWLQSPEGKAAFQEFGQIMGNVVGGGLKTAYDAAKGFLQGLGDSGLGQAILNLLNQMGLWLTDPKNQQDVHDLARTIGQDLGVGVQFAAGQVWSLAQQFGVLFDQITSGGRYAIDLLQTFNDLVNNNGQAYALDAVKLARDDVNFRRAMDEQPNLTPPWLIPTGAGVQNPGRAAQLAHRGLAALASGGGSGSGGTGTNDAYTEAGQMAGHQYLAAFKTTMDTQGPATMASAVASYTTGLHAQLKDAGSTLARDLSDFVQQAVQQGIADALRNARISGNADLRQPGAFRSGGIGLGGAL